MDTFRWVFVEVYVSHSFNFVNMKFVVEVIVFPIKFYRKIYLYGEFITEFCCFYWCLEKSLHEKSSRKIAPTPKLPSE